MENKINPEWEAIVEKYNRSGDGRIIEMHFTDHDKMLSEIVELERGKSKAYEEELEQRITELQWVEESLQQQLAEKDAEIQSLKLSLGASEKVSMGKDAEIAKWYNEANAMLSKYAEATARIKELEEEIKNLHSFRVDGKQTGETTVYSHSLCPFVYCPTPQLCKPDTICLNAK